MQRRQFRSVDRGGGQAGVGAGTQCLGACHEVQRWHVARRGETGQVHSERFRGLAVEVWLGAGHRRSEAPAAEEERREACRVV